MDMLILCEKLAQLTHFDVEAHRLISAQSDAVQKAFLLNDAEYIKSTVNSFKDTTPQEVTTA